jgi:uncharacterized protein YecT (DUF1311 family)
VESRWRRAESRDLPKMTEIAAWIHPDLPERPEVFAEKMRLFPEGCLMLCTGEAIVGYGIAHPWKLRRIPPIDATALLARSADAAEYAPLACARATTDTERTICADYHLGQAEARMATLFEWTTSLVAMGQRGSIQDDQHAFIARRAACKRNVDCIRGAYEERIKQLEAVMAQIQAKGPF